MEFPEDMESDAAMGRGNCLVDLLVHRLPRIKLHMLRKQTMSQLINFQKDIQFLTK